MGVAFELRPEARFNDGTPVTAEDVAWTFQTLREKGRPFYRPILRRRRLGNRRRASVAWCSTSSPTPTASCRLILGQMPVLPKHWWAGREFDKPLTDPPAWFRPLPGRPFRVRPHPDDGTRSRRLVEEPAGDARAVQFRHHGAPNISATGRWRWRRSRPARSISGIENVAKEWATATTSLPSRRGW